MSVVTVKTFVCRLTIHIIGAQPQSSYGLSRVKQRKFQRHGSRQGRPRIRSKCFKTDLPIYSKGCRGGIRSGSLRSSFGIDGSERRG